MDAPHPPKPWLRQIERAEEVKRRGGVYARGLWDNHNLYKVDGDCYIQLKNLIARSDSPDEFINLIYEDKIENVFIDKPDDPCALFAIKRDGTHLTIGESRDARFTRGVSEYLRGISEAMIVPRRYKILRDFSRAYDFLAETYDPVTLNGMLLPQYFEYAHMHSYFDYFNSHRFGIWEHNSAIRAIACYEMKPGECCHLHAAAGYARLLPDMLAWTERELSVVKDGTRSLELWATDKEMYKRTLLESNGYARVNTTPLKIFDYKNPFVKRCLPDGFTMIDGTGADHLKLHHCWWKGFDHGDEPDDDIGGRTFGMNAPHADLSLMTIVVAPDGEYACALGMWFDSRNKYAYLEPLATVPKYRRMGLATAALTEAMKKTKKLGARYCFGGSREFYSAIGFETVCNWELWEKKWTDG